LLPASLELTAFSGAVAVDHGGGLYPSTTGTLSILAEQSVQIANPASVLPNWDGFSGTTLPVVGNVPIWSFGKLAYPVRTGILPTAVSPALEDVTSLDPKALNDPALIVANADSVRIYVLSGDVTDGMLGPPSGIVVGGVVLATPGARYGSLFLVPNAPAQIYAGGDIVDLAFYGTNFTASDTTSIVAHGDITFTPARGVGATPIIDLSGPGNLIVQAGGNINFPSQRLTSFAESGIRTLGNAIDNSADVLMPSRLQDTRFTYPGFGNPFLPIGGAAVTVLAGVGKGIDYDAFAAAYFNSASAGTDVTFTLDGAAVTPAPAVGAFPVIGGGPAAALGAQDVPADSRSRRQGLQRQEQRLLSSICARLSGHQHAVSRRLRLYGKRSRRRQQRSQCAGCDRQSRHARIDDPEPAGRRHLSLCAGRPDPGRLVGGFARDQSGERGHHHARAGEYRDLHRRRRAGGAKPDLHRAGRQHPDVELERQS
jgi:hypothetical protein